ncbi:polysaccharide deacetylase family protein [Candidatus Poribacteria bacterium]|nr:polysaccharide deacetylase family protein [Candidatus Poribacteria bacterium]
MSPRPPAFVQVDVDGLWAVRACYGQPEGRSFTDDPVWKQGTEQFLDLFARLGIAGSFFVAGRDLELAGKRARALEMHRAGHEIANHSYSHTIGMTRMPMGRIMSELKRTDEAIRAAGLPPPGGFRAPGYYVDARVLRAVRHMGYAYDASVLPTRLSPLLRLADAWLARRWQPGKRQFGRLSHARAPRAPYHPDAHRIRKRARGNGGLLELPVSTLPPFGIPLTGSAIFALGPRRVIAGIERLRATGDPLLLLLHGIDLTDCREPIIFHARTPRAGGFSMSAARKRLLLEPVLHHVMEHYAVTPARDWVASAEVK